MSDWEQFQTAYQSASPDLKALIDSEKIPLSVEAALTRRAGVHLQSKVTALMSHLLIGAETIDATVAALKELGILDALQFIVEVQNNLQSTPIQAAPQNATLTSDIRQVEKELETLQTVRTMPHDMAAIKPGSDVVYQSRQADILERGLVQEVPPVNIPPTAPRWDTDTKQ